MIATRTFVTGDGCALNFSRSGKAGAPVLLLAHSLGSDLTMWNAQMSAWKDRFDVVRLDLRGHGQSEVPQGAYSLDRLGCDVLELADALELQRFVYAGLSLGGMIGQWLGVRAPERLECLIIANSAPIMGPAEAWDQRITAVRAGGMQAIADAVLDRWFTPEFRAENEGVRAVREVLLATDPTGYCGCCAAIRDMDLRPILPLIAAPTLVIGGTRDAATPPDVTQMMLAAIPGVEAAWLDAAHLSNIECKEQFASAVLAFTGEAQLKGDVQIGVEPPQHSI